MAKIYMVAIYEKKKPLRGGVTFFGGETHENRELFSSGNKTTIKKVVHP